MTPTVELRDTPDARVYVFPILGEVVVWDKHEQDAHKTTNEKLDSGGKMEER